METWSPSQRFWIVPWCVRKRLWTTSNVPSDKGKGILMEGCKGIEAYVYCKIAVQKPCRILEGIFYKNKKQYHIRDFIHGFPNI